MLINNIQPEKKKACCLFTAFLLAFLFPSATGFTQNATGQEQVLRLIDSYHYDEALSLTEQLLISDSNNVDVILLKTRCLAAFGKYNEAASFVLKAYTADSNNIKILGSLIEMHTLSGSPEKACTYALRRCKLEPSNRYFKYSLANVYYQSEQYRKGLTILLSLYFSDTTGISLQKQIVTGLYELRKFDSATLFCNRILQIAPYEPWAVNKLANIYIRLDDYNSGLEVTGAFLRHDSSNIIILKSNAYLHYLAKDYPNSEIRFKKCISLGDSSKFSFKYLALSQYRQENFNKAYRNFATAYSLDTTDTELCFYYGLTSAKFGLREIGLIYLNKTLSRLKASELFSSQVYTEIASIYNDMEQPDTATTLLVKAMERNPDSPDLLFRMAYQYDTFLHDPESAISYYQRYLASNPKKSVSATTVRETAIEVNISKYEYAQKRLETLQIMHK